MHVDGLGPISKILSTDDLWMSGARVTPVLPCRTAVQLYWDNLKGKTCSSSNTCWACCQSTYVTSINICCGCVGTNLNIQVDTVDKGGSLAHWSPLHVMRMLRILSSDWHDAACSLCRKHWTNLFKNDYNTGINGAYAAIYKCLRNAMQYFWTSL